MTARPDLAPPDDDASGHDIERAYANLRAGIERALGSGRTERVGPMMRIEVDAPQVDLLRWLANQHRVPRIYWADRDGTRRIAGVGCADRLDLEPGTTPAELLRRVAGRLAGRDPALRYYGGFRFDPDAPMSTRWAPFGRGWLVLPRFELVAQDDALRLACNVFPGRDTADRIIDELRGLAPAATDLPAPPARAARADLPAEEAWRTMVDRAITELRTTSLRKLVLARRSDWQFEAPVPPLGLLSALAQHCGPCFQFCFDPDGESAFIGATPERLFRRTGRDVWTEALAGTRPRGATEIDDERLREDMLQCSKEGREHGLVVGHLLDRLAPLVQELAHDPQVSVVRLPHLQHMHLAIRGQLEAGVDDAMLLAALNPTPAVAGDPPAQATERIRALEPFDRGWYAGPVGYVGAEQSEFAVAIRSALVNRRGIALYVGAGIVEGSRACDEWRELESKSAAVQSGWGDG
jgi:menaquinone-specific isochorismate synthase